MGVNLHGGGRYLVWILRIRAVRCIRECGLNVGARAGLGSADFIFVSLEGGDAIGESFRESGRYINRLP